MKRLAIFTAMVFMASLTVSSIAMAEEAGKAGQAGMGQQQQMSQQIKAAGDLKDFSVKDQQGQNLGDVDEVLVDLERGQIGYVVVSTGLIGGEKHIIPFNALQPNVQEQTLTLNIDQQKFQQAPTGETVQDQQQAQQIHQFYGVSPYWEEGSMLQQRQQMQERQLQQPQERQPMQQQERSPIEQRQQERQQ